VTPSIGGTYVAPPDTALVLFVRPAKLGKAVNFYVFDVNKRLVTLFKGNEHVAVTAGPGKHTFYVVSENAELVRAEVGAGRTYVIYTEPRMGLGKARVVVEALSRSSPNFAKSAEWLRKTKAGVPDFAKGNKWASKRQDVLNARIADAEAHWSGGDAAYRAARTMRVEDGRNAAEAGAL
jgi:hypothetical protein